MVQEAICKCKLNVQAIALIRAQVYWLLPAFFPFCIAFGGIIVPKTYLIQDLICRDLMRDRSMKDPTFSFAPISPGGGNAQCDDDNEVQSKTAMFALYTSLLSGIFSAIVAPHFGALSDRNCMAVQCDARVNGKIYS